MPGCAIEQVHGPLYAHSVCAWACVHAHACMQTRACTHARASQQLDARTPNFQQGNLACNTPAWPLESPARGELGGEGVERRGREESTRRGQWRPRPPAPPSAHSAGVRVWQQRCSQAPPGAEAPRVGLGGSPRACKGVDRDPLAPPALSSARCLHKRHQHTYLLSHAQARVVGEGG